MRSQRNNSHLSRTLRREQAGLAVSNNRNMNSQMLEVVRYDIAYKAIWNAFVANSKNGTFLFYRDYMDYHADRFNDHSLLFYRKGKLVALLPANETGSELQSHGGLSYGGIISDSRMKAVVMLKIFEAMQLYLKDSGFTSLVYKAVPHIYHQSPAEEDLYALIQNGAALIRRDLNAVIYLKKLLPYSRLRERMLKKAQKHNLKLKQSSEFEDFMNLEQELLKKKYNLKPTHSTEELKKLAQQFPEHIKLYAVYEQDQMIAGVIIFETQVVAHCQYIGATERGKLIGGLDILIDYLLTTIYPNKRYFSFGISTEQQGRYLNENLVRNKESFGARTVIQDIYVLKL